ncbi:monovalent cation/H+ antiporter complex subunit F [Aliidiomarina soli]|uniref:PH regulation protein F n=1 Tax=Aliidiomarina soli TaxID=1928574 RepID=A0A432WD38_9GAMM|nr:monovalent cation/H+ antiporter complex subunit F [Aliidiomarina soli]RUO30304.1 hypothetical protein CWE14_13100 [Aliidiomarina soli]
MTAFWWTVAALLLVTLLAGLIRIWRGPNPADRMLAAQLFGTTGVAILLVLAQAMQTPALNDVALVLALLAVVAMVAFVRRARPETEEPE